MAPVAVAAGPQGQGDSICRAGAGVQLTEARRARGQINEYLALNRFIPFQVGR